MKKLIIQGIDITEATLLKDTHHIHEAVTIKKIIKVNPVQRSVDEKWIDIDYDEDDNTNIVIIEFDDGTEWISAAMDIPEIFGDQSGTSTRGEADKDQFIMPVSLGNGGQRGGMFSKVIKFVKQIIFDKVKAKVEKGVKTELIKRIAKKVDELVMRRVGLFFIKENFRLESANISEIDGEGKTYLLLLHGFLSRTEKSFGGLKEDNESNVLDSFRQKYEDNIVAFEHRTISLSPIQNAIDILEELPKGCKIDILSQSRGGLVADILARVSSNNPAYFSDQEIKLLEDEEDADSARLLKELNELAKEKNIEIKKVVRVACPARGTTLLTRRLDHWVNAMLGLGALTGIGSPILAAIREFLLEVIAAKATPEVFPGINAQVPASPFQKILNNPLDQAKVSSDLFVVQGDANIGDNIGRSILVILSNLFYLKPNDLIVDTESMRFGARRQHGVNVFFTNKNVHHFNYFRNKDSKEAIRDAVIWEVGKEIPNAYKNNTELIANRGVIVDLIDSQAEEKGRTVTGKRPIVLFLPGIMGSHLKVGKDKVWFHFWNIVFGRFCTDLDIGAEVVSTDSITSKYYTQFIHELQTKAGYDVQIFPYDWRKSLHDSSKALKKTIKDLQKYNQPIKIVAHSMGGMVVKTLMMDIDDEKDDFWEKYISEDESRFIMLGSPWQGAYKVMSLLVGYEDGLKQLINFDIAHGRKKVLKVVQKFEGLFQLLPLNDKLDERDFWSKLSEGITQKTLRFSDPYEDINFFEKIKKYRAKAKDFKVEASGFEKIYYIAGFDKEKTIAAYKKVKDYAQFGLHFPRILEGDGTVTWDLGIPKGIPNKNLYYTQTIHSELANDKNLFEGLIELLNKGTTKHFSKTAPVTSIVNRSGRNIMMQTQHSYHNGDLLDSLMGTGRTQYQSTDFVDELNITITHAHLKVAAYPVMVGHFKKDGILSAEAALSKALGGKLEERQLLTNYPGDLKDNLIIYNKKSNPKGAIVVGLGDPSSLTAFNLMQTVEAGVLNYALYGRDNAESSHVNERFDGISSLCIGSAFGQLALENALKAILNGISNANAKLRKANATTAIIKNVEFIEIFQHVAAKAYHALMRIESNDTKLRIKVHQLQAKHGAKRKLEYLPDQDWWHQFTTEWIKPRKKNNNTARIKFLSSAGIAKVEEKENLSNQKMVTSLLQEMSRSSAWDAELSKTLFELLIPNAFKEIIRNQTNILWKMDVETAAFPWEMFHDLDYDTVPTFVNAGLIRQLRYDADVANPEVISSNTALVIGDPIYKELRQLPAAKAEAIWVSENLKINNYKVTAHIGAIPLEIIKDLYNKEYKMLHVAGHGVYRSDNQGVKAKTKAKNKKGVYETGIVLGDLILGPRELAKFSKVPEFVFINCCDSGTIEGNNERSMHEEYKFAANIGTQLISMGVSAVVVTGWPVNDAAAAKFAKEFYQHMFDGYYFGEAVQKARKKCYDAYQHTATWAAYQCYGSPWYRLDRKSENPDKKRIIDSLEELEVELDNLYVDAQNSKHKDLEWIKKEVVGLMQRAKDAGLEQQAIIVEKEAQIYAEIEEVSIAIEIYDSLLKQNKGSFSVRSLEQYCNLRARDLYLNKRDENMTATAIDQADETDQTAVIDLIEAMVLMGETSERCSLLGGAHKRIVMRCAVKLEDANIDKTRKKVLSELKTKHLKLMTENYKKAYDLVAHEDPSEYTYAYSNWLTANYFSSSGRTKTIKEQLEELITITETLQKTKKGNEDYWRDIAHVNILMCQLFYCKSLNVKKLPKSITKKEARAHNDLCKEKMKNLPDQITKQYKDSWEIGGSYKKLRSELEHLEFVRLLLKTQTTANTDLIAIFEKIEKELRKIGGL